MKKILALFLCLMLISGCTENGGSENPPEVDADMSVDVDVDVDFTKLSSTMVSAQMDIIMQNMQAYVGQTMKIRGNYYPLFWEVNNEFLHFIIIECSSGCDKLFEFVWNGEHIYPDDYPPEGTFIELPGVFGVDEEGFPYLAVDDIVIVA
ncbi:MAG: hypothetical protein FWD48_11790 [Oscillospiraceae bacterium]|nr:hypothetical protein [Oscillospiraceae bacterium]